MIKNLLEDAEKFCNSNPDVMTAFKTGLRVATTKYLYFFRLRY